MEGKALKGWSRRDEGALCRMLEDMGGGRGLGADALNADEHVFDRGLDLAKGRAEPSDGERPAFERFKRRVGE